MQRQTREPSGTIPGAFPERETIATMRENPVLRRAMQEVIAYTNHHEDEATWPRNPTAYWRWVGKALHASPAFAALCWRAGYDMMPAHYTTDLVCVDRACLLENPARPFAFGLRHLGTHLIFAPRDGQERKYALATLDGCNHTWGTSIDWFLWTGERLARTDAGRVRRWIEGDATVTP